jgi:Transposase DDE domain
MRHDHCTITPAVVRHTARHALQQALPWQPYGQLVSVARLLGLLLLVAALRSSLSAVVRRCRFGFSHQTARQALAANLPGLDQLTQGLVRALHGFGGRRWRQRRWDVAIDLHYCPFYGDRRTRGIVGGPKKQGSKYHYAYATAVLLHRRHRYTVGLLALDRKFKPHEVVAALLAQLDAHGLRLRGVVLDSGFDSGETLLLLQGRGLSYTVPLRRKGASRHGRNACFGLPPGTVTEVAWVTKRTRQRVRTAAVVAVRRRDRTVQVYAFGGWGPHEETRVRRRARLARMAYRRRFGIETSYRQQHQGQGHTTKKDVGYRLLLVGLALLLRQVWVYLSGQVARARGLRPTQWVGELPLRRLLDWLAEALKDRYPEAKVIHLGQPLLPPDSEVRT